MLRVTTMVTLASLLLVAVQGAGQDLISPEQAKKSVRAFEGDPNLQFGAIKLRTEKELLPPEVLSLWPSGVPLPREYEIEAKDPDRRAWSVNARTGEVTWAYYPDAIPNVRSEEPFGPLTKEECRQIAENFARAKYAGFDDMNFELEERWTGEGWEFEWKQKLAYGALGANFVKVEVNPADGRIQVYQALRIEQQQPRQPKITREQAIEIAKQALKLVEMEGVETTLTTSPTGNVRWSVVMGGALASGDYLGGIVYIDAETGSVIDIVYEAGEFPQRTMGKGQGERPIGHRRWQIGAVSFTVLLVGIILLRLWRWHLLHLKSSGK